MSLTVVGKGKEKPFFASLSHPRFRFVPYVTDRTALRRLYAEHDVLLSPGRSETFGLTALEAMAAGLVVVGPDAGGTGELLQQVESPFMFTAGDPASFGTRVGEAVRADLEPHAARGRALAHASYGTWTEAMNRQMAMYESITAGRARG